MSSVSKREDNNNGIFYSQTGTCLDKRKTRKRPPRHDACTLVLWREVEKLPARSEPQIYLLYFTRATLGLSLLTDRRITPQTYEYICMFCKEIGIGIGMYTTMILSLFDIPRLAWSHLTLPYWIINLLLQKPASLHATQRNRPTEPYISFFLFGHELNFDRKQRVLRHTLRAWTLIFLTHLQNKALSAASSLPKKSYASKLYPRLLIALPYQTNSI